MRTTQFAVVLSSNSSFYHSSLNRMRRSTLSSLVRVSRKSRNLWLRFQVQKVSLRTNQIHSFLLLLLKHPDLGSFIRELNFVACKTNSQERDMASKESMKLVTINHPRLMNFMLKPDEVPYDLSLPITR